MKTVQHELIRYKKDKNSVYGQLIIKDEKNKPQAIFQTIEPNNETLQEKGIYTLNYRYSIKFERRMWYHDNERGKCIHKGNNYKDTNGCILIGTYRKGSSICYSKLAFITFIRLMDITKKHILTIKENT